MSNNNRDALLEYHIAKLTLATGDVLVVKIDAILPIENHKRAFDHFKTYVPASVKVLIIDRRTDISVLTQAQIEELAA